jgi:hypothetical protein
VSLLGLRINREIAKDLMGISRFNSVLLIKSLRALSGASLPVSL